MSETTSRAFGPQEILNHLADRRYNAICSAANMVPVSASRLNSHKILFSNGSQSIIVEQNPKTGQAKTATFKGAKDIVACYFNENGQIQYIR